MNWYREDLRNKGADRGDWKNWPVLRQAISQVKEAPDGAGSRHRPGLEPESSPRDLEFFDSHL